MSTFFFFNDTATTEIYTLSLHDALPISARASPLGGGGDRARLGPRPVDPSRHAVGPGAIEPEPDHGRGPCARRGAARSEEHTSELQSRQYLVCRLLLEQKKTISMAIILI